MTDGNKSTSAARILLVGVNEDDEERIREELDGVVKPEAIKCV